MIAENFNHVNYVQTGAGAPVIMVHGLAASLRDWKDLMPALDKAGYHSYALDLLGHGESAKPESLEDYHIENVFDHFAEWTQSLHLDQPPIIVSHSLGGYLAIEYALRYPNALRALVLASPFYALSQLPRSLQWVYRYQLINAQLFTFTPSWMIRFLVDLTSLSLTTGRGPAFVLSDSLRAQTTEDYKRVAPGIFNIPHTTRGLTPFLEQINLPALIIYGMHDNTLRPKYFQPLIDALHARSEAIQDAGHVVHQSHAEQFNQLVIDFLKGIG
jgi:2-succinyl-6-hydroxy-2,4-cyclohexadiene-1-carboxylate synthase